nr:hypothetical protein [Tanacetum cinerariifolium]
MLSINILRNAIGTYYLFHPSEYVAPPSINDVRQWFSMIGYGEEISVKWTLKKSLLPYREKVISYTRFVSLLLAHKMKEDYGTGEVTKYPTQTFIALNWALKPNIPKGPSFTTHMLAICNADEPVPLKAPKSSSQTEMKASKGKMPGAQTGSSEIPTRSKTKETKAGSSKNPAGSKKAHSRKRKESRYDASKDSTSKADPRTSAPNDSLPPQQVKGEGTKTYLLDHIFVDSARMRLQHHRLYLHLNVSDKQQIWTNMALSFVEIRLP